MKSTVFKMQRMAVLMQRKNGLLLLKSVVLHIVMSRILEHRYFKNTETRLILLLAGLFTLTRVFTSVSLYFELVMSGQEVWLWDFLFGRIVAWLVAIFFVVIIVKTTNRFLMEERPWGIIIGVQLVFAVLITLLWYSTFLGIHYLICSWIPCMKEKEEWNFFLWYLQNFNALFFLYLFTVSVTYTYYYIGRDSKNKVRQANMEKQLLTARLETLRSQIHPHFLFNTLNSVAALVEVDGQKAKNMIADLSDLLRNMLDQKDAHLIPLKEELEILEKYTAIEKVRFSDHLNIKLTIQEGLDEAHVPAMLFQPLIENSIRHGFSENHQFLHIEVKVFSKGDTLYIEVSDDGCGVGDQDLDALLQEGVGLRNTYERLTNLYKKQFTFRLENLPSGVVNRIEFPLDIRTTEKVNRPYIR